MLAGKFGALKGSLKLSTALDRTNVFQVSDVRLSLKNLKVSPLNAASCSDSLKPQSTSSMINNEKKNKITSQDLKVDGQLVIVKDFVSPFKNPGRTCSKICQRKPSAISLLGKIYLFINLYYWK